MKKVRTQIQLESYQYERLKEESHRRHQSLSRTIRQMIDSGFEAMGQNRKKDLKKAFSFVGCISGDKSDVAERHDEYLSEAFGSDRGK